MTVDQILYVASRIHDWDKEPVDIVGRSIQIVGNAEMSMRMSDDIKDMQERGLGTEEMLAEILKKRGRSVCSDENHNG